MAALTALKNLIGRFRLRTVLTVCLVTVLVSAMGITGLLSFQNSQYAVSDLVSQWQNEVSDHIVLHLDGYLNVPHLINRLIMNSISIKELNVDDFESLKRHFQELSYQFNAVTAICYGNERNGNYSIISRVGKPGLANETERFWAVSPLKSMNYSYEEYRIGRDGQILEKTFSYPHYDPPLPSLVPVSGHSRGSDMDSDSHVA